MNTYSFSKEDLDFFNINLDQIREKPEKSELTSADEDQLVNDLLGGQDIVPSPIPKEYLNPSGFLDSLIDQLKQMEIQSEIEKLNAQRE